jgi:hypothetical protein
LLEFTSDAFEFFHRLAVGRSESDLHFCL